MTRSAAERGLTIGAVIGVIAVAMVLVFTLATLGTTHLNFAQRYAGGLDAQYLAEAAVSQCIYAIHESYAFGQAGTEQVVVQPDPNEPRRNAVITFNKSSGLPYSTNNAGKPGPAAGWNGGQVPVSCVRLLSIGSSRGVTRTVEVLVSLAAYPYVIACDGAFQANGALLVKGATNMADVVTQEGGGSQASPASMGCNSSVTDTATVTITGDLVAAGTVSIGSGSTVGGQIRSANITLPYIDVTVYDPTGQPGAVANPSLSAPITGQCYCTNSVVASGDLTMNGGLLYVKGNLTVNGGLTGSGAVIVTGTTTINKGADLAATNLVALVSVGDITINGDTATKKYLQGLVYTQGKLTASNITVAGTMIAGGFSGSSGNLTPGSQGGISLTNVAVYSAPETSDQMFVPGTVKKSLNLNKFIRDTAPLRIISWKER